MSENVSSLDFKKLRTEFNISDEAIQSSGFSRDELSTVFLDYNDRLPELVKLKNEFLKKYLVSRDNLHIHSYNGRVKDPYHLIEKIVRKRHTHDEKYTSMRTDDYYKYITDLIGIRMLLVYKESWKEVHDYLVSMFQNDPSNYIDDKHYAVSYDKVSRSDVPPFMAEYPVVYTREGDNEDLYIKTKDVLIKRPGYYRSVHYIVRYGKYYIEIQVRTLFEEAWGEVDHDRLYPLYKDNPTLVEFSSLLNRTAGLGDELSTFFKNRIDRPASLVGGPLLDVPIRYNAAPVSNVYNSSDTISKTIDFDGQDAAASSLEQYTPRALLEMEVFDSRKSKEE